MTNNKNKYNAGNVKGDAEIARPAEEKAIRILELAFDGKAHFDNLHDKPEYWHRGDVRMTCGEHVIYGDVKDESRIYETRNVFAENYKYFHSKPNQKAKGWMRSSQYDLVFILDDIGDNLYILDFPRLKRIYENYTLRQSRLSDCNAYGNCVPLRECRKHGVLRFEIKYKENNDGSIEIERFKNCSKQTA